MQHDSFIIGKKEDGFSLLMVAVLLSVAAMIAATALQKSTLEAYWNPKLDTEDKLNKITSALEAYQRTNKRLPCVASRSLAETNSSHGMEQTTCPSGAAAIAGTVRVSVAGKYVRIGAVPYKTLQIQAETTKDAWGNKMLYAVSEPLTDSTLYKTTNGNIRVDNIAGILTNNAAFTVLSHGKDGKGAYRNSTGSLVSACTSASGKDQLNCNDAGIFWQDSLMPDAGANYNDDQLVWKLVDYTAQNSN